MPTTAAPTSAREKLAQLQQRNAKIENEIAVLTNREGSLELQRSDARRDHSETRIARIRETVSDRDVERAGEAASKADKAVDEISADIARLADARGLLAQEIAEVNGMALGEAYEELRQGYAAAVGPFIRALSDAAVASRQMKALLAGSGGVLERVQGWPSPWPELDTESESKINFAVAAAKRAGFVD